MVNRAVNFLQQALAPIGVLGVNAQANNMFKVWGLLIALSVAGYFGALRVGTWADVEKLSVREHCSAFSLTFVAVWWVVYFLGDNWPKLRKLTTFLEEHSLLFGPGFPDDMQDRERDALKPALESKSVSWISSQSLYMAVIALFSLCYFRTKTLDQIIRES